MVLQILLIILVFQYLHSIKRRKRFSLRFAPLTGTAGAATGFLVENYNNTGVTKDLNQIFEPLPVGGAQAEATNFLVENYNGAGQKDLNQIFKPL
jgi:hypothetical protein